MFGQHCRWYGGEAGAVAGRASRLRAARCEELEPRLMLSTTPIPTIRGGNYSVSEGSEYTLMLGSRSYHEVFDSWMINWGDGAIEPIAGNPSSVFHTYLDGPAYHQITATATNAQGTFPAVRAEGDGSRDYSLSVTISLGDFSPFETALAVQPDGKIITASGAGWHHTEIVRTDREGRLDYTFGNKGRVPIDDSRSYNDIELLPDGKILVATSANNPLDSKLDSLLVRLNPDGSLDTTFGTLGKVYVNCGDSETTCDLAVDDEGRILVSGSYCDLQANKWLFFVFRCNPDGTLDTSFGEQGIVKATYSSQSSMASSMALLSDGRIAVGGYVGSAWADVGRQAVVACFTEDGQLDASFGDAGKVILPAHSYYGERVNSLIALDDGRIVGGVGARFEFSLFRLQADGQIDSTFGNAGRTYTTFGSGVESRLEGLTLDEAGRIIAVGTAMQDAAAVRYTANGVVDSSFGLSVEDIGKTDCANSVAISPEGKIIIAGYTGRPNQSHSLFLIQLNGTAGVHISVENRAPRLPAMPNISVDEGQSVDVVTSFSDPGILDQHLATVDWGDGTVEPAVVDDVLRTITARHVYADGPATHRVLVNVSDEVSSGAGAMFYATVRNVTPVLQLAQSQYSLYGQELLALLGTIVDPGSDMWSASIDWGDGTTGQATITDRCLSGSHSYAQPGTYAVTVLLSDGDGGTTVATAQVAVLSTGGMIADLMSRILVLHLPKRAEHQLLKHLELAQSMWMDPSGSANPLRLQLEHFVERATHLVDADDLGVGDGDELVYRGNLILADLA